MSLLPLIIPVVSGTLVLILGALRVSGKWLFGITVLGLLAGVVSLFTADLGTTTSLAPFFTIDRMALFFVGLTYVAAIVIVLYVGPLEQFPLRTCLPTGRIDGWREGFPSETVCEGRSQLGGDPKRQDPSILLGLCKKSTEGHPEVFYGILLYALFGMGVASCTTHLAAFFLGLEIYTAGLYILIGFDLKRPASTEAAIKYLVLGGLSSGFILLGISLLYLEFGELELVAIAHEFANPHVGHSTMFFLAGTASFLVGVCFKLSLVPFHMWAPDIYEGAPTPVSALVATASKAAVLALLIRYLSVFAGLSDFVLMLEISVSLSLVIGNLLALYQNDLKRLLAYSSISHMGYAAVPLCVGGGDGWSASVVYLVTYVVTVLAAFGFILAHERETGLTSNIDDFRGVGHARPMFGVGMALAFFSLAGIPMTAGFIGKLSIFKVALAGGHYLLVGAVIIGAALGVFYYLRVVAGIYFKDNGWREGFPSETVCEGRSQLGGDPKRQDPLSKEWIRHPSVQKNYVRGLFLLRVGLLIVTIGILLIGLYPEPLLKTAKEVTSKVIDVTPNLSYKSGVCSKD